MRLAKITCVVFLCLFLCPWLWACGTDTPPPAGDCGPNGPCPSGFTCLAAEHRCVASGGTPDAAIDAHLPDAGLTACTKPTNHALTFAGAQQVTVADSPSLRPEDITIEAWARFSALPFFGTIVAKPFGNGTGDSYSIWYEQGRINGGANPSSVATGIGLAFAPTLGDWHHFTFTFDHTSQAQRLYVDGVLAASGTTPATVEYDDHPLLIGGDENGGSPGGFFQGDIDEVKIWRSVRDATEVPLDVHSCTPGSFTGLAGYWPLDEGSGQVTADVSGNGNDGVIGASSTVEASDPAWTTATIPF
jgi:hypothetical protein